MVAGGSDPDTQAWLLGMHFPLDGGINGLAASSGEAVWTSDYGTDPRIPHDADDKAVARRLNLCGMAAAPLRAPGGEVIGTLAISSALPRTFAAEELDLLQGLADQAAIAITNSTLLTRLTESEERYRYLVENAPDMVWSIDADGAPDLPVRRRGADDRLPAGGARRPALRCLRPRRRRAKSPTSTGRSG